ERLRVDGSGNVTVGSTVATQIFEVEKNQNLMTLAQVRNYTSGSIAGSGIAFGNDAGLLQGSVFLNSSGNNTYAGANSFNITNLAAAPIAFTINNAERMRITGTGNVGIGTGTPIVPLEIGTSLATGFAAATTDTVGKINDNPSATSGQQASFHVLN